ILDIVAISCHQEIQFNSVLFNSQITTTVALRLKFIFNLKHTSKPTEDCLKKKGLERPNQSPHLNPTEKLWEDLNGAKIVLCS
uniref:Uncharacterized protein n=1 Tax=Haplochromis burtoni TaxID=8153 RepID=A0A3Q2X443_HAPBU